MCGYVGWAVTVWLSRNTCVFPRDSVALRRPNRALWPFFQDQHLSEGGGLWVSGPYGGHSFPGEELMWVLRWDCPHSLLQENRFARLARFARFARSARWAGCARCARCAARKCRGQLRSARFMAILLGRAPSLPDSHFTSWACSCPAAAGL